MLGRKERHTQKRAEEGAISAFMPRVAGKMGVLGVSPRGEKEGEVRHCATEWRGRGGPVDQLGTRLAGEGAWVWGGPAQWAGCWAGCFGPAQHEQSYF
jgi:hypothetical protein